MSRSLDRSLNQMMEDSIRAHARRSVLDEIHRECRRQDSKWGRQTWPHFSLWRIRIWKRRRAQATRTVDINAQEGRVSWEDLLWEEFCEAMSETDWSARRAELIQVAAVIVAEIEDGDLNPSGD